MKSFDWQEQVLLEKTNYFEKVRKYGCLVNYLIIRQDSEKNRRLNDMWF